MRFAEFLLPLLLLVEFIFGAGRLPEAGVIIGITGMMGKVGMVELAAVAHVLAGRLASGQEQARAGPGGRKPD